MKERNYGAINVTIRLMENDLLSDKQLLQMMEAETLAEALTRLGDTPYRNDINDIEQGNDFRQVLNQELRKTYRELDQLLPQSKIIELTRLRYSYHNLKLIFKEQLLDRDLGNLYIPTSGDEIEEFRQAIKLGRSNVLSDEYLKSIDLVKREVEDFQDYSTIDIILDQRYFEHLAAIVGQIENELIKNHFNLKVDTYNLTTALRASYQDKNLNFIQAVLAEGGNLIKHELALKSSEGPQTVLDYLLTSQYGDLLSSISTDAQEFSLIELETRLADLIMEKMIQAKYISTGPMPTLAYLHAKETEITNLRLILTGIENNVPKEVIQERVLASYVS